MKGRDSSTTAGPEDHDRLDRLGGALIKASALTQEEVEAASSPLAARMAWAQIAAERERRPLSAAWLDLLLVGRRAVPAMLVLAVTLAGWCWIGRSRPIGPRTEAGNRSVEEGELARSPIWLEDDVVTLLIDWPGAASTGPEDRR